ncbi:MAG: hypothetical protein WCI38_04610 [Chthoniobacterales bacterium]|jgi:hypothetical protein
MGSKIRWDFIVLSAVVVCGYPLLLWGLSVQNSYEKSERALFEPRTGKLYSVHQGVWNVIAEISRPRSEGSPVAKINDEVNPQEPWGEKRGTAEEEKVSEDSTDKPELVEAENKPDFSYDNTNTR